MSTVHHVHRRAVLGALLTSAAGGMVLAAGPALAQSDPLPSWNDGRAKQSILDFVTAVTREGSLDFVPMPQRIATFDNDGTLWCEQPMYVQLAFALDQVKALAPQHPDWKTKQPFKAVLDGDRKALAETGERGLVELVMATHANISTGDFERVVTDWISNPRFKRSYTDLVYQDRIHAPVDRASLWRSARSRSWDRVSKRVLRCAGILRYCFAFRRRISSTTDPASRLASTNISGGARSPHLAIRTAICRCCNGRPRRQPVAALV